MDPLTLAALKIAEIIARNPNVQGVLTKAAGIFWALLTETKQTPTMNDLLAQQRDLAVKMAQPTFRTDFTDHVDYYELLLMVTTLVTYIKRNGCLYQDFYSGEDNVYFPPPVEAPSLGTFEETGRGIRASGQTYLFYLLIRPEPNIDQLREYLDPAANAQGEPDSFLRELNHLEVEYTHLFGISTDRRGRQQFRVNSFQRQGIDMRFDPATPERISQDLLNLIDQP